MDHWTIQSFSDPTVMHLTFASSSLFFGSFSHRVPQAHNYVPYGSSISVENKVVLVRYKEASTCEAAYISDAASSCRAASSLIRKLPHLMRLPHLLRLPQPVMLLHIMRLPKLWRLSHLVQQPNLVTHFSPK
jgi:hypothetical protein